MSTNKKKHNYKYFQIISSICPAAGIEPTSLRNLPAYHCAYLIKRIVDNLCEFVNYSFDYLRDICCSLETKINYDVSLV